MVLGKLYKCVNSNYIIYNNAIKILKKLDHEYECELLNGLYLGMRLRIKLDDIKSYKPLFKQSKLPEWF